MKHLGEYLDIHCGGIDNAFPHHTNEIAQSEAYLGHKWCNYWFHVHHLNTNSGKMSKSSGEFLTVSLLEEKGYNPVVYRFFCLLSHYRKSLVFSYENLDNAATAYNKMIAKIAAIVKDNSGEVDKAAYDRLMKGFTDALDNDINTALAITALYDVLRDGTNNATKFALIKEFDKVLSLSLIENAEKLNSAEPAEEELPAEVIELAEQRKAARKEKNFALADELRDKITALGYVVEETRQGTKIYKQS
jgi:cysteinyl-tRNA synthetase